MLKLLLRTRMYNKRLWQFFFCNIIHNTERAVRAFGHEHNKSRYVPPAIREDYARVNEEDRAPRALVLGQLVLELERLMLMLG